MERYCDCTNKPTWTVREWLRLNEELAAKCRDLCTQMILCAPDLDRDTQRLILGQDLADMVCFELEGDSPGSVMTGPDPMVGLGTDLATWALSLVCWEEVADAFLAEGPPE